jgi:hypothetical protein
MSGIGVLQRDAVKNEFDQELYAQAKTNTLNISRHIKSEYADYKSYPEFVAYYRQLRTR